MDERDIAIHDDKTRSTSQRNENDNDILKKLKSNILLSSWGIVAYQLISSIVLYAMRIDTVMNIDENSQTYGLKLFLYILLALAFFPLMLYIIIIPIIPFVVSFVSSIFTTFSLKHTNYLNGTYTIFNYIFQIHFLIIVWITNTNTAMSVIFTIISFIGMYISYIASKYLKSYNEIIKKNIWNY